MAPLRGLLVFGLLFSLVHAAAHRRSQRDHHSHPFYHAAVDYLNEFGYLTTKNPTYGEMHTALETFQNLVAVEPTGELDDDTVDEMKKPRCGNHDVSPRKAGRRPRFVYRAKWENKVVNNVLKLTWYISSYTKDVSSKEIKTAIRKAFEVWATQTDLPRIQNIRYEFEEAYYEDDADIIIMWATGDHDDPYDFDDGGSSGGKTNVLAHTFYPTFASYKKLNGDIHLDDYETWVVDPDAEGANILNVVTHEIGHSLGLGHSAKESAVMFPIYRQNGNRLDIDDKCALNWSYVGSSPFCVFMWLMSEIMPTRTAEYNEADYTDDFPGKEKDDKDKRLKVIKRSISETDIPLCRETNYNRYHFQKLLTRRLHFPHEEAHKYTEVVCNFFEGMNRVFGRLDNNGDAEGIFKNTVHEYIPSERRSFERMVRRELRRHQVNSQRHENFDAFDVEYFDEKFFDGILQAML